MDIKVELTQTDDIVVFGSGTIAGQCIKLLRGMSTGNIFVFEKKQNQVSVLKNQISGLEKVYFRPITSEIEAEIQKINPKIIFSINNIYIFKESIVNSHLIINYHNSLLPRHPGRSAEAWAIYSRDKETGITWHLVSSRVDKGDIILQEIIPLSSDMTAIQLLSRQTKLAFQSFQKIVSDIFNSHCLHVQMQEKCDNVKFHFSWEKPNDGELDLSWDIDTMYAFLRAMDYGKLSMLGVPFFTYQDKKYIWSRYSLKNCEDQNASFTLDLQQGVCTICQNQRMLSLLGVTES